MVVDQTQYQLFSDDSWVTTGCTLVWVISDTVHWSGTKLACNKYQLFTKVSQ